MWDLLKKLWRWFSELDTTISVFNWIKLGIGIMAGLVAGLFAWLDAQPASILFVLALATLLIAVYLVNGVVWLWGRFRIVRLKGGGVQTKQLGQNTDIKTAQYNAWSALAEKDPANTLIILFGGIERIRLQGDHPAWEVFFAAYNGGVGDVELISASGSFKIRGQAYPTPVELKSATPAKHGEITLFTVRQWIDQRDVPRDQLGQNHVVLQLSDLKIEAIAIDPVSGKERLFVVPLPDHLQFDVRHHWNIHPEYFSRFYRKRLGTDDNEKTPPFDSTGAKSTAQPAPEPEFINLRDAVIDAWERIRKLPEFDKPPPSLPDFDSLREYYEADPVKMTGIVAQVIFNAADPPIPIKGISPPRTVMEVIPKDTARGYMFSDDATEMFNIYDKKKPAEQRRRYTNLHVKRTNIERRVKAIEEDNGKG